MDAPLKMNLLTVVPPAFWASHEFAWVDVGCVRATGAGDQTRVTEAWQISLPG
jgi:hypothetical protein